MMYNKTYMVIYIPLLSKTNEQPLLIPTFHVQYYIKTDVSNSNIYVTGMPTHHSEIDE